MKDDKTIQQKLYEWADRTADFYHNKAKSDKKFDIAFYTQSNLTEIEQSPELLILAINPGSEGSYEGQISKDLWQKWGVNDRMDGATLLKGNPTWEERNTWTFWQRLNNIFNRGGIKDILQDKSRFVFSNLTLFATKKAKDLPNILNECTPKTIELIEILQPKHILCLGGAGCIDPLKKEGKFETKQLLPFNLLSFGKFNSISVYSIRHTASRPAYTIEEMNLIGKCLKYLFDNTDKDFTPEEIQQLFAHEIDAVKNRKANPIRTDYSQIKIEVPKQISEKFGEIGIVNYDGKFTERYLLTKDIIISIIKNQMGYVAIRHKDFSIDYKSIEYPHQTALMNFLQNEMDYNDKNNDVWLAVKHFSRYGYTTDEIISKIVEEVKEIKVKIEEIMSA